MTKQAKPRKEPCTARCPEKCRCVKCHLYDGAFGGLECTCTTASDQLGQAEKIAEEMFIADQQKQPDPAGGEDRRKLEINWHCRFHPTDWFHETGCPHQQWTTEQLQGALEISKKSQIHQLNLLQQARTSAFNECKERTIEIVSKAKADTPQTFEYIALEKVKQKILALHSDGND